MVKNTQLQFELHNDIEKKGSCGGPNKKDLDADDS